MRIVVVTAHHFQLNESHKYYGTETLIWISLFVFLVTFRSNIYLIAFFQMISSLLFTIQVIVDVNWFCEKELINCNSVIYFDWSYDCNG